MALNVRLHRNVRVDWAPIAPTTMIEVAGTVPMRQDYCPDTGIYTPDYTLVGLTLQPKVVVACGDGSYPSGPANARIDNIEWWLVESGTETRITQGSDFDLSQGAVGTANAGRLIVMRNSNPNAPTSLRFKATLVDDRLGQTHQLEATIAIRCTTSEGTPRLTLDTTKRTSYNPLRDPDAQTIRATLQIGSTPVATAKRLYSWEVLDDVLGSPASWRPIGSDILDYWASVNDNELTIDRKKMGYGLTLRCRAAYDRNGNPSLANLTDASPTVEFGLSRVMRGISAQVAISRLATSDTKQLAAQAFISDNQGELSLGQVNEHFSIEWRVCKNSQNLSNPSYTTIAHGNGGMKMVNSELKYVPPLLPTDKMDGTYGMEVDCKIDDLGPLMAWQDSDGKILTDGNGDILLIK